MAVQTLIKLKPIVHFREFPFGTIKDPSMREFMAPQPWENQSKVVEYLRSGVILGIPMGASLSDWFDPADQANPTIEGRREGGVTPLTDGVWFWPAGLIHFIEKYNVALPEEFVHHAAQNGWRVDKETVSQGMYDYDY
jgi:hypothetical protein